MNRQTVQQRLALPLLMLLAWGSPYLAAQEPLIVNDVSQLNPIRVRAILKPTRTQEIIDAVKNNEGPISIGGARHSMGGQTATEQALQIDMRQYDSVLSFSEARKEITVQAGITWRKVQAFIDPYDLSVQIMQTYADFTVGGTLSVNAHGRYVGRGPVIRSVKEIRIVTANGELVPASPDRNKELFFGAIGGYGGLGVITQATLALADNRKIERTDQVLQIQDYKRFFFDHIRNDSLVVFHNADIYPNRYKKVREISYRETSRGVTVKERLKPVDRKYGFNRFAFMLISEFPGGKWIRQHLIDPLLYLGKPVEWRNYEASYDAHELEPRSRKRSTYVLQEYFVPVEMFDAFYPRMTDILKTNHVNVINISIRHAVEDPGSILAWANEEVFAFVLYYKQRTREVDRREVQTWTRQLIEAALSCHGTFYLPYQVQATPEQFTKAYPGYLRFFKIKKELDPTNKFTNRLWDAYYPASL